MIEVAFTYSIGTAIFTSSVSVEAEEWNGMDEDEKLTFLTEAAMSEVEDMIEVDVESAEVE